jgi:MYXO-CTERM domain-containing protein
MDAPARDASVDSASDAVAMGLDAARQVPDAAHPSSPDASADGRGADVSTKPGADGGCSCDVVQPGSTRGLLVGLALVFVARRRRRRSS